ncbi:hypothetical protein quinque_008895 [Culex quinquefasciatus]
MQLTQLIYDRGVIWNRSHPDHPVLAKRDEAFDEVARELGMLGWATDRKHCPKCSSQYEIQKSANICVGDLTECTKYLTVKAKPVRVPAIIPDEVKLQFSFWPSTNRR